MTTSRFTRTFNRSERGGALLESALLVSLIAVACVIGITYRETSDEPKHDIKEVTNKPVRAEYTQLIYRGNILTCVDFAKMPQVGGVSLSCLFADFYQHPRIAQPSSKLDRADIVKVVSHGKTLYCVHRSGSDTVYHERAANCDDIRFAHDPMSG